MEGLDADTTSRECYHSLTDDEVERYARQIILPGMGLAGQLRLKNSRVLLVGAGGLGCPAAEYLAGAGVGTLGIVDGDVVEVSNLHRQISHAVSRVGMNKAASLVERLRDLNPLVQYEQHQFRLSPLNAESVIARYDLVLDCTDNLQTRYLISDVCVLLGKPFVSAGASTTSGQLIVLNCPPTPRSVTPAPPCYRCIFRDQEQGKSCSEVGVLGPVVGMFGIMQAGEAIKIIVSNLHRATAPVAAEALTNGQSSRVSSAEGPDYRKPTLVIFGTDLHSNISPYSIRALKMVGRRADCFTCGAQSTLSLKSIREGHVDYAQSCRMPEPQRTLLPGERVTVGQYHALRKGGVPAQHVLIDVREEELFSVGHLDGALNMPFSKLELQIPRPGEKSDEAARKLPWMNENVAPSAPVFVVCRVGNDSQEAVHMFKERGLLNDHPIFDIAGGMKAWKDNIDPQLQFL